MSSTGSGGVTVSASRSSTACASSARGFTISISAACKPRRTISWAIIRGQMAAFRARDSARTCGKTVLDIGCNGGFYSIEMKRRGRRPRGGNRFRRRPISPRRGLPPRCSGHGNRIPEALCLRRERTRREVRYRDLHGVLYHLRHPLLALDLIHEHVAKDLFIFQSMQRGSEAVETGPRLSISGRRNFRASRFSPPVLHREEVFRDPTNWWIPNRACTEAMLRSAGFRLRLTRRPKFTSAGCAELNPKVRR